MKSYHLIEHQKPEYNRYNYNISSEKQKNKNEIITLVNYNQNKEIKKTIKPSISSSNCSSQNNKIKITPIKRNNSNTKIKAVLPELKNNINKKYNTKNKYILTIVDRRQNFLDYKNNQQQRNSSFSRFPPQQKVDHKIIDKSFDYGNLHSKSIIDKKYDNYNNFTANYKNNKTPLSIKINNNKWQKQNCDRRNLYTNLNINSNDKERLSTDPKTNYNIYISDSSNKYISNNYKKNENQQKTNIIKHNRIYSLKTGNREDLNKIENKLLGKNNINLNSKRQENKKIYSNYIMNTLRLNNNNLDSEKNKLRKSFDNTDLRNDNNLIISNKINNNNYFYESKNLKNNKNNKLEKQYINFDRNNYIRNTYDTNKSNISNSSLDKYNKNKYIYKPSNEVKYESKNNITYDMGKGNYSRNKTPIKANITNNKIENNKYNLSNINQNKE